jgi:predicted PurR-regulated permease PerM
MKIKRVEISPRTIIFTVLFLLSLYLLWNIRSILLLFFVCFILMEAINPVVNNLQKIKIPRILSIGIIYLVVLAVLFFAFAGMVPILIEQTTGLIKTLPNLIQNTSFFGLKAADFSSQLKILDGLPGGIANFTVSFLSNLFSAIIILIITFYLLLDRKNFPKYSVRFFKEKTGLIIMEIIDKLEVRLGNWVNAELLLMISIGILSYIAYLILGLKYALSLAIITGLLEIVPNIGSIISVLFASIMGLTISPTIGILTLASGIVIQQLESNLIAPQIMKGACDISPVITILLLLTGATLGGIMGAILAIPIYMTIEVVIKVVLNKDLRISSDSSKKS